jgi:membrane protein
MEKKFSAGLLWKSLKDAASGFSDDKVTKLSASLAYYTGFSLAPLLILLMSISTLVFGAEAVQGTMDNQIRGFVGGEAAKQIQDMMRSAALKDGGVIATIIGAVTLVIGATTVFGELQDSMNSIWGLKPRPNVGLMKTIQTRVLSFGVIASLGFILLVSLAATSIIEGLMGRLQRNFPDVTVILLYVVNLVVTMTVVTALISIVFKVLPDAKIQWRHVLPGAITTSLLFMLGKFAISLYISKSDMGSAYGAAGSLAVIFVWIYYSSIILYFGAEFTKAYAFNKGARIVPDKYAEWNTEPTVPGAEPKEPPVSSSPSEREQRPKGGQPAPQLALASTSRTGTEGPQHPEESPEKKDDGPGVGGLLLGLALYFVTRDKKKEPNS